MVATAVFLALYLVVRTLTTGYVPLFGAQGARVGVHGVFTIMPAILFGPWYGAVASGLGDMLGHFANPTPGGPPWLWQMTVILTIGGFVRGWVWRLLRGRSTQGTRIVIVVLTGLFLIFGSISAIQLRLDGIGRGFYDEIDDPSAVDVSGMGIISRMVISRTQNTADPTTNVWSRIVEFVYAPLIASGLGILLLGLDFVLSKRLSRQERYMPYLRGGSYRSIEQKSLMEVIAPPWNGSVLPVAVTIVLVSLMVNTSNSVLLWAYAMPAWGAFPFMYIWLPRVLIALLNSIVNVFIAVMLLGVCYRQPHMRRVVG